MSMLGEGREEEERRGKRGGFREGLRRLHLGQLGEIYLLSV